jgi:hypothetical protein
MFDNLFCFKILIQICEIISYILTLFSNKINGQTYFKKSITINIKGGLSQPCDVRKTNLIYSFMI